MTQTFLARRRFLGSAAAAIALTALPAARSDGAPASEYGIVPDSSADQTAAFRRALAELSRRGAPLRLPAGRFVVSELPLESGTGLIGTPGATRIVAGGGGAVLAREADRIVLDGLVFEGSGTEVDPARGLVDLRDVERVEIVACALSDSTGNGLHLERCGGTLRRNRIERVRHTGIFCRDGHDLEILDNQVTGCGDNGIQVWQSEKRADGARVSGNTVTDIAARSGGTGQNGNGINVFRAGNVIVSDNRIRDCAFSAIRNHSADDAMIRGNMCHRLGEVAIYSEFAFEGAVIADNLVDGAALGISVTNFNDGGRLATVASNLIRNIDIGGYPEERGIGISVEADTAITGNTIETCSFAALKLGHGPYLRDVAATGNVLRKAPYGIAVSVVDGAGSARIANNVIAGMDIAPIAGTAWDEVVVDDLAENPDAYPRLAISGNTVT